MPQAAQAKGASHTVKAGFAYTRKGISAEKMTPSKQGGAGDAWGCRRGRGGALEANYRSTSSLGVMLTSMSSVGAEGAKSSAIGSPNSEPSAPSSVTN